MGREVCGAVDAAGDLELGPRIDLGDDLAAVADADVAVVFSVPDVALDHVLTCVRHGVHAVVGTTGWTTERLEAARAAPQGAPRFGALAAPNFPLSAPLLPGFAALAPPPYPSLGAI